MPAPAPGPGSNSGQNIISQPCVAALVGSDEVPVIDEIKSAPGGFSIFMSPSGCLPAPSGLPVMQDGAADASATAVRSSRLSMSIPFLLPWNSRVLSQTD